MSSVLHMVFATPSLWSTLEIKTLKVELLPGVRSLWGGAWCYDNQGIPTSCNRREYSLLLWWYHPLNTNVEQCPCFSLFLLALVSRQSFLPWWFGRPFGPAVPTRMSSSQSGQGGTGIEKKTTMAWMPLPWFRHHKDGHLLQVIHPLSISTPGQGATPPPPAFLNFNSMWYLKYYI